jgi:hypothetical protein
MAVIFTDNFTRADQSPLTTPWTTVTSATPLQIVGNKVRSTTASGTRAEARYGSFTLSEMKTTLTIATLQGVASQSALVRQSATAATNYGCLAGAGGQFVLIKQIAFSYTEISAPTGDAPTAGQTVGCQALGSTIKGFEDGVEILSASDSAIATGTWGIDASVFSPSAPSDCEIDDVVLEAFEPFFVAAGTAGAAASGNITPGTPGATDPHDLEVNDVVVMAYHGSDQVAVTVPGSWTQIVQGNGGGTTSRLGVWWLRYAGGAFPSALITHTAGASPIAGIAAFRNCPTSGTPFTAGTIAGGTVANIDHNGITPGGTANALLLAINGSADDNARTLLAGYTNVFQNASNNAFITALGTPDGSVSMFFKSVPLSATGTVTVAQAAADPWASVLVALHQAAAAATPINVTPAADSFDNWVDSLAGGRQRIGWVDSVAFDKSVGGPTPITRDLTADVLNNWADSLRHSKDYNLTGDSMPLADQALTVDRRGILIASLPADSLNNWADSLSHSRAYSLPADDLNTWADSLVFSTLGGLAVVPAADSLNNWADSFSVSKAVSLPADSLNNWADSSAAIETFSVGGQDNLSAWNDSVAVSTVNLISITPSADSLNNWLDSFSLSKSFSLPADSLNNWVDSAALGGTIAVSLPSDSLNNWGDSFQLSKAYNLTGDSMTQADQLAAALRYFISLSDNLAAYSDTFLLSTGAQKFFTGSDILASYNDQVVSIRRRVGWLDSVVFNKAIAGADIAVSLTDSLVNYSDSLAGRVHYSLGYVVYLVDGSGNYIVDENGNRIIIAGFIDTLIMGDALTVNKQDISVTPISRNLPADSLQNWADTLRLGRGYNLTDAMTMADAPAIIAMTARYEFALTDANAVYVDSIAVAAGGDLRYNLAADNLAAYADQLKNSESFSLPAESLNQWAEELDLGQGYRLTDSLGLYADQTIAVAKTANLLINLTADAMTMADQPVAVEQLALKTAAPPADAMSMTDAMALGWSFQFVDDLDEWADALRSSSTFRLALTDDLNSWIDIYQLTSGGALKPNFVPDSMVMADSMAITLSKSYALTADAMVIGDQPLAFAAGVVLQLTDNLAAYADTLRKGTGYGLADALPIYADSVAVARVGNLIVQIIDAKEQWGDAVDPLLLGFDEVIARVSDSMANWDDVVEYVRSFYGLHLQGKAVENLAFSGRVVESVTLSGKTTQQVSTGGKLYTGDVSGV